MTTPFLPGLAMRLETIVKHNPDSCDHDARD